MITDAEVEAAAKAGYEHQRSQIGHRSWTAWDDLPGVEVELSVRHVWLDIMRAAVEAAAAARPVPQAGEVVSLVKKLRSRSAAGFTCCSCLLNVAADLLNAQAAEIVAKDAEIAGQWNAAIDAVIAILSISASVESSSKQTLTNAIDDIRVLRDLPSIDIGQVLMQDYALHPNKEPQKP